MLSKDAKNEWMTILGAGLMLTVALAFVHWSLSVIVFLITVALVLFFRDPDRSVPPQRNVMVAPADGKVSSVHHLDQFAPLDGPATCIRIFLSVLDVHINRNPCHALVQSVELTPGLRLNALNPQSAEDNEANLIVLVHPMRKTPVAAVRQVAGLLARTIHCSVEPGQVLQRGQRIGLIKLGSTTELYIPDALMPEVKVKEGDKVQGAITVLASYTPREAGRADSVEQSSAVHADEMPEPTETESADSMEDESVPAKSEVQAEAEL